MRYNQYNQPIGDALENYQEGEWPSVSKLEGKTVILEKLSTNHIPDLYEIFGPNGSPQTFTYIPVELFNDYKSFEEYIKENINIKDPYVFSIIDKASNKVVGTVGYMHVDVQNRVAEMGWVIYSEKLKKTRQATEAQFLAMEYIFDVLKYRRYQWRCDHFNEASRNCALRLGFTFEGTHRQAMVYKNRTRDSDFLSIMDFEWEKNKKRLQTWLADENFDENGQQKQSLSKM